MLPPAQTIKDRAQAISQMVRKNSVKIQTVEGELRVDLQGAAHKGVETPHVQRSIKNVGKDGRVYLNKDSKWVREATQQDIRMVRNYLKKIGKWLY